MTRIGLLRAELEPTRSVERVWNVVREMVDERSPRTWHGAYHAWELKNLGLSHVADHVLVGLTVSRSPGVDPVEEAIRRDAFQRSSVIWPERWAARSPVKSAITVWSFCPRQAAVLSERSRICWSCRTASGCWDVSALVSWCISERASRPNRCRSAGAIRRPWLRRNQHWPKARESCSPTRPRKLPATRSGSSDTILDESSRRSERAAARFDRYIEAVIVRCGYRLEAVRAHLDVGFDQMTGGLLKSVALDQKNYAALYEGLERAATNARTLSDLLAVYRRAVLDVSQAVQAPVEAQHDRSLRRAVDYVHQHYTDTLSIKRVARLAGFSESYFSRLFKKREHKNFADYVCGLRVERAKQLLASTGLDMRRVAELSDSTRRNISPGSSARQFPRRRSSFDDDLPSPERLTCQQKSTTTKQEKYPRVGRSAC